MKRNLITVFTAILFCLTTEVMAEDAAEVSDEYLWLYEQGNPGVPDYEVVEKLHDQPVEVLTADKTGETICHLMAKRGNIAALYVLLQKLDGKKRADVLKAAAELNETGFAVHHYVVLYSQSPFWCEQFAELGMDFSKPPKSEDELLIGIKTRWGAETKAYAWYLEKQQGKSR